MFPSLAVQETYIVEANFAARKQKLFSLEVKNSFVSQTQLLRPQHMFPSLAMMETILISFQCCSLIKKCFQERMEGL